MKNDKIKIAFIGAGARMAAYAENFCNKTDMLINYSAVCDTSANKANLFKDIYGNADTSVYTDYHELLDKHDDVDGIVITTPNYTHEEIAIECLKQNKHILLEKPLSISPQSCLNIIRTAENYSATVTLGYVLRYTPFYRSLKNLLENNSFGQALTVTAEELVGKHTTRMFAVGWRNRLSLSGGLMIEKCCHDMDIFYYLLKKYPQKVYSVGSTTCFVEKQNAGLKCSVCTLAQDCPYYVDVKDFKYEYGYQRFENINDDCVYLSGMDICDHQSVVMEYEDGLILNFTVTLNADKTTRTFRMIGTEASVYGDFEEGTIVFGGLKQDKHITSSVTTDGSGHGGGDGICSDSFIKQILYPQYLPEATLEDGFHSVVCATAVERSLKNNTSVELADIYTELGLKDFSLISLAG